MVKNFGNARRVQVQVLSPACYSVPTHWVGRSVPCAGEDCPMCPIRQPRMLWFVGLAWQGQSGVYEVAASLERAIDRAWRLHGRDDAAGVVVSAGRSGPRDEWAFLDSGRGPLSAARIAPAQVAAAVAAVYRLPKPMLAERFVEWFERVRVAQAVVLENSVLPIFDEMSSRGSSSAARN
jgi:hypothetical protein